MGLIIISVSYGACCVLHIGISSVTDWRVETLMIEDFLHLKVLVFNVEALISVPENVEITNNKQHFLHALYFYCCKMSTNLFS